VDDLPVSVHTLRMFLPCRYSTWIIAWAAVAWVGRVCAASQASSAESIDFNRDIRPIFSENCYACHGPDEGKRKAGLRLDVEGDAFKELKSGKHALIPGDTSQSTLITRIKTTDLDEVMPPPKSGKSLSPEQIGKLTRWVEQGAKWKNHWSFIPPERPPLPQVKDAQWPRNEIDRFVLSEMERRGFTPNPEADRATLIRRATLDLTGLPPTVEEVDRFLTDSSPDAYEKLVDRLLEMPQYGERMAQNWLDLARYADTSGYHFDGVRFMWLWRDWVIRSFNDDKPYDQFTIEQLAGDLLPDANQQQRVATGFLRNNMTNDEGGADPDEYLNKYIVDRVNTVGAVWLGLTVGCSECHDHKYDPLTTREFYRMYAFFHGVPEKGLDRIRTDNPPPRLPVPGPDLALRYVEADFNLRDCEKTLGDRQNELGETQEKWERETNAKPPERPSTNGLFAQFSFDENLMARGTTSDLVGGVFQGPEKPAFSPGRMGRALQLDGKSTVDFGTNLIGIERTNTVSLSAWVKFKGSGAVLSRMEKAPGYRGFDILISDSRFNVHLINSWPDNALKVTTRDQFPENQWLHLVVTLDGSGTAGGIRLYVDGKSRALNVEKDQLKESIVTSEPLRIGSRNGEAQFTGNLDEIRFYNRVLSGEDVRLLTFEGYRELIAKSGGTRTDEEQNEIRRFYRENYAIDFIRAQAALAKAKSRKEELQNKIPTTMVMEEMDQPRDTYVLVRGDFRSKGEKVTTGTPAFLPPLPEGVPANRLALAKWLTSPKHPLMSRVTVNRYWAMVFGTGIVKTINDFGSQGEWPSHPELIDWLATQFRDGGNVLHRSDAGSNPQPLSVGAWDVKGLMRMMLTSATYRQSAAVSPDKLERDPYNRYITRGPRIRLEAESIRDNALAISGLLNRTVGGPSVKPYQPPGIWDGTDASYEQDHNEALYRRGMYVFWRRSAHYPSFATFDAPNREVCTFLRQRTQTPLQSLVLMNDPAYVEAARALAQRVLREEPTDLNRRLVRAFRHALGRPPRTEEISILSRTYQQQLDGFHKEPKSAEDLLKVGELKKPEALDSLELAAMTTVANVLLNLNETITK